MEDQQVLVVQQDIAELKELQVAVVILVTPELRVQGAQQGQVVQLVMQGLLAVMVR